MDCSFESLFAKQAPFWRWFWALEHKEFHLVFLISFAMFWFHNFCSNQIWSAGIGKIEENMKEKNMRVLFVWSLYDWNFLQFRFLSAQVTDAVFNITVSKDVKCTINPFRFNLVRDRKLNDLYFNGETTYCENTVILSTRVRKDWGRNKFWTGHHHW